ncbi:hypothetical protein [Filimonas effusa]|uniref:DUF928 domain-containing protein n=1 Tax=Filimonas effusa TaxID=2508721 RepID=A0A4Q1DBI8_9BACT|nr:hypothetical protein [Filimonas effusa]RXK86145.1 hypothetical protein ESB13_04865 [Filimonas effusa]
MTIKSSVLFLLLLYVIKGYGQLTLTLQVPSAGVVQKTQLWNFLLVNGGAGDASVQVTITLMNAADNTPVMTAVGKNMMVPHGAMQVKPADVSPVQYRYHSPAFNADLRPEGFLPVGTYIACYSVSSWQKAAGETLLEDCITLEVQPLSPPVLHLPGNNDTIGYGSPRFSWLPPAPLQLFGDLSYDLLIAKLEEGQSPEAAIRQNRLVYNAGRLKNNFISYPASNALLDTGQTYAWCVVARNNGQLITQSEVWTFNIAAPGIPGKPQRQAASFVTLTRNIHMADAVCEKEILVAYGNEIADSAVSFVITSLGDAREQVRVTGALSLSPGHNFTSLPAVITRQLLYDERYLLEVINSRNEHWYSKFRFVDTPRQ